MSKIEETLRQLAELPRILQVEEWGEDAEGEPTARVEIERSADRLAVSFHAAGSRDDTTRFLQLARALAPALTELTLTGEDEGVNGTRAWPLHELLGPEFPRLTRVDLEGTKPGDHNGTIVVYEDDYEENGALGRLLDGAPNLLHLSAPSAPTSRFIDRAHHPLRSLTIQTGFKHHGFVRALAASRCFSELRTLTFVDYFEKFTDDLASHLTPADAYEALFADPQGLPALRELRLVNAKNADAKKLRSTPLARQLDVLELSTLAI